MSVGGRVVELADYWWTDSTMESNSYSKAAEYEVMVGRTHVGDENGGTRYQYARVVG
ncbi:hypothetical protein AB0K14_23400 [Actinosynnema sp. NPDC050801]|uniref:hypothetical protein n=1 Tax=unclassified Actinosynnema TaxID=2637065 RepID=UPI0033EAF03F